MRGSNPMPDLAWLRKHWRQNTTETKGAMRVPYRLRCVECVGPVRRGALVCPHCGLPVRVRYEPGSNMPPLAAQHGKGGDT